MFFLFLQGVPENKKIFPSYIRPYTQTRLQLKSSVKFKIVHIFGLIEWAFILSKMSVKKVFFQFSCFFGIPCLIQKCIGLQGLAHETRSLKKKNILMFTRFVGPNFTCHCVMPNSISFWHYHDHCFLSLSLSLSWKPRVLYVELDCWWYKNEFAN